MGLSTMYSVLRIPYGVLGHRYPQSQFPKSTLFFAFSNTYLGRYQYILVIDQNASQIAEDLAKAKKKSATPLLASTTDIGGL